MAEAKKSAGKIEKVITPVFRANFVNLAVARSMRNEDGTEGKPKFGITAVWSPDKFTAGDKSRYEGMKLLLDKASMAKFNKHFRDLPADSYKKGLRKGEGKELEGFGPGTVFASLTTQLKVGIVDKDGNDLDPSEIYSGCYCRATVNAYGYSNKGKGVALGLMSLQKVADGARLDGRTSAAEDFSEDSDLGWMGGENSPAMAEDDL